MNKRTVIFLSIWVVIVIAGISGAFYLTNSKPEITINYDSLSPVTRSAPMKSLTEDSIFIKKLERDTQKLFGHGK